MTSTAATTALLLIDVQASFTARPYWREAELPDSPLYDRPHNVLFGTGAAMFVPRDLYRRVGGFQGARKERE